MKNAQADSGVHKGYNMPGRIDRRSFMKNTTAAVAAGGVMGMSHEEKALLAAGYQPAKVIPTSKGKMPMGKIRGMEISRLICGGNLINGFAHSRDLIYVSSLLKHYFTDEKIMDTWQKCEENGINTMISTCDSPYAAGTDPTVRVINRYRKERRGRIQWIAQCYPKMTDLTGLVKKAIDNGAIGIFIQGEVGDVWIADNRLDLVEKVITFIKDNGLIAGIAGHSMDVPIAVESSGIDVDFYMKTLHHHNYWSSMKDAQNQDVIRNSYDNYWSMTPRETIEFMQNVKKPWIAYKVLAAGAIEPQDGFNYAFSNGADFACVGMCDFQVEQDCLIAQDVISKNKRRMRPWRA